jgi:mono/diheme cytochrome c family protein
MTTGARGRKTAALLAFTPLVLTAAVAARGQQAPTSATGDRAVTDDTGRVRERDSNWVAPDRDASKTNPLAGRTDAEAGGRKIFHQRCATCHANDGRGTAKGPDLTQPDVQSESDGALFWKITSGNTREGMPTFSSLPEAQRWQLVLHVRRLTGELASPRPFLTASGFQSSGPTIPTPLRRGRALLAFLHGPTSASQILARLTLLPHSTYKTFRPVSGKPVKIRHGPATVSAEGSSSSPLEQSGKAARTR